MPTDFDTFPDRGATRFLKARDFGDVINVTFRFLIDETFDRMDETRELFARDEVQRDLDGDAE